MNLTKLFETQKVLRDRIGYNEPDRFNKLVLSLLVELGECANEWRGFKFWSKDQKPRVMKSRVPYMDLDDADFYNPLLEEYVDGLHFVLELGLILNMDSDSWFVESNIMVFSSNNITDQFNDVFQHVINVKECDFFAEFEEYEDLVYAYLGLGKMLGFTWEEVEQAYFAKNKINHFRQESGY